MYTPRPRFLSRLLAGAAAVFSTLFLSFTLLFTSPSLAFAAGSTGCGSSSSFFGLKPWYSNLKTETVNGRCEISAENFSEENLFTTVWSIILTILSDIFFVAGLAAVIFVIYAGARYILSAGNVAAATQAKNTLIAAVVGLIIVLVADIIVNTILGLF